ncbi:MAG: ROK family protein [Paracoccaceae bacterium]
MLVLFDIGGTQIRAARAHAPGQAETVGTWPTPADDLPALTEIMRQAVAQAGSTRGVAVSIAGVVDPDSGRIRVANIPALDGRVVATELQRALGLPVAIANDADCFALAEAGTGAGAGHRIVFGVILGTGVGGGLVVDGRIHRGAGGYAGEWGHGPILRGRTDLPDVPCGCGLGRCLDPLGSARGLERIHAYLHGAEASSEAIVTGWQAGDTAAGETVARWRDTVGDTLAMVLNVVGASVAPVGGGLANSPALIAELDRVVRAGLLRRTDAPLVVPARHRVNPGLIGAGLLGFAELGAP